MASLLLSLLFCTALMSIITLCLHLFDLRLSQKVSPKGRSLIWTVVLLGFVILWRPALFRLPVTDQTVALFRQETQVSLPLLEQKWPEPMVEVQNAPPPSEALDIAPVLTAPAPAPSLPETVAVAKPPVLRFDPVTWGFALWLAGASLVILLFLFRHLRFWRFVRRWSRPVTDEASLAVFLQVRDSLHIQQKVQLHTCEGIESPLLMGLFSPRVLLPNRAFSSLELRLILHHELSHLKRKDLWRKALALLARAIHWFNPLVILAARQAERASEESCDASVLKDQGQTQRALYGQTILDCLPRGRGTRGTLTTSFYGGKKDMKKRLKQIMDQRKKGLGIGLLILTLLITSLPGIYLAQADKAPQTSFNDREPEQPPVVFDAKPAVLKSPIATYVGLCEMSDDYEIPAASYVNGLTVSVTMTEKSRGGYPVSLTDANESWAYVTIQVPDNSYALSGWVPEVCLTYLTEGQQAPEQPNLPEGSLSGSTGKVELLYDNRLTDQVVAAYENGTRAKVLGRMKHLLHVQVEDQAGFVRLEDIQFDRENQLRLDALMPEYQMFSDIMPGHTKRFQEYQARFEEIHGVTDDETVNPSLEKRAALSALALEYGYEYMSVINLVPGPGDLTEAEAARIGREALVKQYGYTDREIQGVGVSFYRNPGEDAKYYRVVISAGQGRGNASVTLNQEGQPVDYYQAPDNPRMRGNLTERFPTLQEGDSGDKVKNLQHSLLYSHFYQGEITGEYDQAVTEAVKQAQEATRQKPDGIAHPFTQAILHLGELEAYALYKPEEQRTRDLMTIAQGEISYYSNYFYSDYPGSEDLTQEMALKKGEEIIKNALPDLQANDLSLVNATFHRRNDHQIAWWMLKYRLSAAGHGTPLFEIALIAPTGEREVHTSPMEFMRVSSLWREYPEFMYYLTNLGYSVPTTWTAQEKAQNYPDFFRVPDDTVLSQEKAFEAALEALKREYSLSPKMVEELTPAFALTTSGRWIIHFFPGGTTEFRHTEGFKVIVWEEDGQIKTAVDPNAVG